jgi:hypothetical protein
MNERIRELAREAGFYANPDVEKFEKFAELIVRECCEVAHCNFHVDGLTLGGIMKKHFGVE